MCSTPKNRSSYCNVCEKKTFLQFEAFCKKGGVYSNKNSPVLSGSGPKNDQKAEMRLFFVVCASCGMVIGGDMRYCMRW